MIQAAKKYFRAEGLSSNGKLARKIYVGLAGLGLMAAMFFYWHYLTHLHTFRGLPPAASRVVPAPVAPPAPVPMSSKTEVAASIPVSAPEAIASTNTLSPVAAKAAPSFSESLMAVLSPSAKAAAIQPEMPREKISAPPSTVPASRVALKAKESARPVAGSEPKILTAEQKRLKTATASFAEVIDLAFKHPDTFGFAPDEPIYAAKLGDPIPVYTVPVQDRRAYKAGQPVKPLLQPTEEWIYPVVLSGQIRFMVPVKLVDHEYVAGTASRALGLVYEKILQRWPASEGFHPQLVVNPAITGYYFTIPELPSQNLTDTCAMFQPKPALSPATVILASWR